MKITDIFPHRTRRGRVKIFIDGKYFFHLPEKIIAEKDINMGDILSPQQLRELEGEKRYSEALEYARLLLSFRIRSEKEILNRLEGKGFENEIRLRIADTLKEKGEIDDLKFARSWIRSRRQGRPKGDFAIRQELKEKGVSRQLIEKAFESLPEQSGENKVALALEACGGMLNKYASLEKNTARRRLRNLLKRRGFDYETVLKVEEKIFN